MTIRTLVVEDDFRVADVHQRYAEEVGGFEVVGIARNGMEALEKVRTLRPDLLLLDIYLPDIAGDEVLRRLRQEGQPPVDVIAITAAKDVETIRAAMRGGAVHYLIKPFTFSAFREKLRSYAAVHERLGHQREADQGEVDRLYGLLRAGREEELPKGLSSSTRDLVLHALREGGEARSAAHIAGQTGLSRVTARRYLDHLGRMGLVEVTMRYGTPGRPEHHFRLARMPASVGGEEGPAGV